MNQYNVCKRWWMILDELVGRSMAIGIPTPFMKSCIHLSDTYYGGVDKIDYYGVRKCHVGDFLDASDSAEGIRLIVVNVIRYFLGPSVPQLKYPHLLHQIHFHGAISSTYFESLMNNAVNLKHMVIHWAAMATLDFTAIDKLRLPNLELFYLWGTNLLISSKDNEVELFAAKNFKGSSLFNNLKNFFRRVYFPKLRLVTLEVPYNSQHEESLMISILEFLGKHSGTLWSVKYAINCDLSRNIRKDNLDRNSREKITSYSEEISEQLYKLKSLELSTLIAENIPHFSLWTNLMNIQNSLLTLCTEGTKINQSFLQQILTRNENSLTQLRIANLHLCLEEDNMLEAIDCRVFQNCKALTTLSLEGTRHQFAQSAHHYYLRSQIGGLKKCAFLPETLTSLHIKTIAIESTEVATISLRLQSLKRLWLMEIGCSGTLGMTYNILVQIMENQRRFELLYISGGINGSLRDTLRQYTWCLNRPPYISEEDMKLLYALENLDPIILELNPHVCIKSPNYHFSNR